MNTGKITCLTATRHQTIEPTSAGKITDEWRFTVNGRLCGVWNYRRSYELRGEFSAYGPRALLTAVFGDHHVADRIPFSRLPFPARHD